jgi:uncharacterized cupin superfamily protein
MAGLIVVWAVLAGAPATSATLMHDDKQPETVNAGDPAQILKSLKGTWKGNCKTWFRPDELADESEVTGSFEPILGGRFLRHTYESTIQGKPRTGEETIVWNATAGKFEVSWIDDFHMSYGIMFSRGESTKRGFVVTGSYDVGKDQPPWGWKTTYELIDDNHLTITAWNILPDGREAKAVETQYVRQQP